MLAPHSSDFAVYHSVKTVYSLLLLLLLLLMLRPSRLESGAGDRPGPCGDGLGQPPAADE